MTIRPVAPVERMMKSTRVTLFIAWLIFESIVSAAPEDWQPANGPLMTRWAKDVSPKHAHSEYPRPQMVRKDWQNLNGLWDYSITDKDAPAPKQWQGKILVPFPI